MMKIARNQINIIIYTYISVISWRVDKDIVLWLQLLGIAINGEKAGDDGTSSLERGIQISSNVTVGYILHRLIKLK